MIYGRRTAETLSEHPEPCGATGQSRGNRLQRYRRMNMTPEKRARVNELFTVAVETDSASTARLDLENEDEDVRLELARLLRLHLEAAESFVRPPSESDFPSTFRPGEVVASRYTILERVG